MEWEKKQKDTGVSDKEVLKNPRAFHSYVVEAAMCRILLELMEMKDEKRVGVSKSGDKK